MLTHYVMAYLYKAHHMVRCLTASCLLAESSNFSHHFARLFHPQKRAHAGDDGCRWRACGGL